MGKIIKSTQTTNSNNLKATSITKRREKRQNPQDVQTEEDHDESECFHVSLEKILFSENNLEMFGFLSEHLQL